jgi:hypothetical protein
MATITQKFNPRLNVGATPWGNAHGLKYTLETGATGAALNADSTAAIAIADKVRIGVIPAGTTLLDSLAILSVAMTAAVTGKIGFEYVDGVDVAAVPQDDDYFLAAGQSLATAARLRNVTTNASVTLPKDAWLILTTAGAANAKASKLDFIVFGASEGVA